MPKKHNPGCPCCTPSCNLITGDVTSLNNWDDSGGSWSASTSIVGSGTLKHNTTLADTDNYVIAATVTPGTSFSDGDYVDVIVDDDGTIRYGRVTFTVTGGSSCDVTVTVDGGNSNTIGLAVGLSDLSQVEISICAAGDVVIGAAISYAISGTPYTARVTTDNTRASTSGDISVGVRFSSSFSLDAFVCNKHTSSQAGCDNCPGSCPERCDPGSTPDQYQVVYTSAYGVDDCDLFEGTYVLNPDIPCTWKCYSGTIVVTFYFLSASVGGVNAYCSFYDSDTGKSVTFHVYILDANYDGLVYCQLSGAIQDGYSEATTFTNCTGTGSPVSYGNVAVSAI